jgi:hypothetical protein
LLKGLYGNLAGWLGQGKSIGIQRVGYMRIQVRCFSSLSLINLLRTCLI